MPWCIFARNVAENQELITWAEDRLNVHFGLNAHAIGVRNESEPLAVIVYNNFRARPSGLPYTGEASIVSTSPRWAGREVLRQLFYYPFVTLGLTRLYTICEAKDQKIRAFNAKLGFVQEGFLREGWDLGGDAVLFSMLPHECKWLRPEDLKDVPTAA